MDRTEKYSECLFRGIPYYNVPGELSKRTTGIGYGKKTTFEDRRGYPPPNRYQIGSEFGDGTHGISFGLGREVREFGDAEDS